MKGLAPERSLRREILESWQRCRAEGIDPEEARFLRVAEEDLQRRLDSNRELIEIASLHLDWISSSWTRFPHVLHLIDCDGIVLYVTGNDPQLRETLRLIPGYDWSERQVGTNGAGTALSADRAISIIQMEHFARTFHEYTCTGAPVHTNGRCIGAIGFGTPGADENPERVILTAHTAYIIEQELMHRQTARQAEAMRAEATTLLANSLDYKTTLSSVARLIVPRFADWCMIDMLEEDRSIVRLAVVQADPSKRTLAEDLKRRPIDPNDPYGAPRVVRTGRSELYPEVSASISEWAAPDETHLELIRKIDAKSVMVVPIAGRGPVLGAITFLSSESRRRYSEVDLALAEDLARRAALAIENAQLYGAAQREIAERKRAEEALRQKTAEAEEANRAKSQFVSIISHELRTPLNAIIGYSGLLRPPYASKDPAKQAERIDRIYYNAQILLELINNLLNLNRMEAGQMPVETETVFVAEVAGRVVDNLRAMGEEKGLKVELINEHVPPPIRSDLKKIEQIIRNLISNAIKFTDRGSVTVRLLDFPDEQCVGLEVADTGIGIEEEDIPRLFEPFYQADPSDTRSYEGSGLGLSIVKRFTELLGGTVQVASELGGGATFTIRLPYEMPT
jgi:signal transduction histidine kinase